MANQRVAGDFYEVSKLAKYPFEPYWPEGKLRICVTGAGGFIASHLARRLKSEGHHIVACDWKRNEHMPVGAWILSCRTLDLGSSYSFEVAFWQYERVRRRHRPLGAPART